MSGFDASDRDQLAHQVGAPSVRLAEELRRLRKTSGLSQEDLAEKVGRSQRSITTYEQDGSLAVLGVLGVLDKLARLFEVELEDLLRGSGWLPQQRDDVRGAIKASDLSDASKNSLIQFYEFRRAEEHIPELEFLAADAAAQYIITELLDELERGER